jgi:F-type H+-transporting ATPase subunit a
MPHHTSWFHYLLNALFGSATLESNMHNFGKTLMGKPVGWHSAEPLAMSVFVVLIIGIIAWRGRAEIEDHEKSVIPDPKLSLRTFLEVFIGYFYDMMKGMMGPKRAKRYFPIIGTCAFFIFFSNVLGLLPGITPPTSTWSITAGCALVVFVSFNYYGLKENGLDYIKHFAGPWLGWAYLPINILVFPLEIFSTCLRPITLSVRLMINMAVDHLLLAVFMGLIPVLIPIPIMMLGTLVALIQVLVFCLLSSIYITLATDHEHDEAHGKAHGKEAAAH